jgi:hypothetical protein
MNKPTYKQLRNVATNKGYQWLPFQLVGIRSSADKPNEFDDLLGVVSGEGVIWHTGTTNPGVHWLKNLLNPKGAAVLAEGQHLNAWVIGKHKGQQEALVQYAPLPVYRDGNKNDKSEQVGKPIYGHYGINIHRANANAISKIIDKWSAGCQVRNNPKEHDEFMKLCKNSGVKYFSYILFNEKDFL